MSGPTRPPSGGASRQPWSPEQAPKGVTCPACGLANDDGVRTCRNCGLPIAGTDDPVRGVAPGRVAMPSTQRSGVSALVGLALVVGLLLVAGTLAVSGGGILSSGGRLGVDAVEGHRGEVLLCEYHGIGVMLVMGRRHVYEGDPEAMRHLLGWIGERGVGACRIEPSWREPHRLTSHTVSERLLCPKG